MKSIPTNYKIENQDILNPQQSASFINVASIQTVLLEPGDEIHRFIRNYDKVFSDCWISRKTLQDIFHAFTTWEQIPERLKTQYIKNSLAVLENWNTFEFRTKVILSTEVVAYVGQAGPQKQMHAIDENMDKAVEFRIGGFEQIVIPRFKSLQNDSMSQYSSNVFMQRVWNLK